MIDCHWIVKFLVFMLLTSLFISSQAKAEDECLNKDMLKSHSGHYARKEFWDYLSINKNWSAAVKKFVDHDISAVNIDEDGSFSAWLHWWEGVDAGCVKFQNSELWLEDDGPFILVGASFQDEAIYTEKLFGRSCYQSNAGEKWCFTPNSISINSRTLKARLVLSASMGIPGTPSYGTPLQIDEGEEKLWMFVPTVDGWKVFQDTFEDAPNYKEIDPNKIKPWRILKFNAIK